MEMKWEIGSGKVFPLTAAFPRITSPLIPPPFREGTRG